MVKGNCISIELQFWRETLTFKLYMYVMYIVHVHCITDYYAHLLFFCKPSKFRPIIDTQVALTNFHGDETKKIQNGQLKTTNPQFLPISGSLGE